MRLFGAAMMSVYLAIVACGPPAPAPNKDFPLDQINDPAQRAATEQGLKERKRPWTVLELFSYSNGFKGLVYAHSDGDKEYAFAMKRGDVYYHIDSTGMADAELQFFDKVKAGVESIK